MRPSLPVVLCTALLALACGGELLADPEGLARDQPIVVTPEPEPAPEPEPPKAEPEEGWIVIVVGHRDKAETEAKWAKYQETMPMPDGKPYPALVDSSDIEGLNPGVWIIAASIVPDEATAKKMAEAQGRKWEGAYFKKVTAVLEPDVDCATDPRCLIEGWRRILIFDYTDGMESEDWAYFGEEVKRIGTAAGIETGWDEMNDDGLHLVMDGDEQVGAINIQPIIHEHMYGYVFAMQGKEPMYQPHEQVHDVIAAAEKYFGDDFTDEY